MTTTVPSPQATGVTTIATRLRAWAERAPGQVAMREKDLGLWREVTFGEYWEAVQDVAYGLLALGVAEGDRVAVHSENRPEWLFVDVAAVGIRAATMGLYPTNPAAEVAYLMEDSGARVLIAEDQEQVDKVLAVRDRLPHLARVIYIEPRGVRAYDDPLLMSWEDFLELGRARRRDGGGELERRMAAAEADDLAALVYTSGTTGPPKGAMLSVANIEFAVSVLVKGTGLVKPAPGPGDLVVSYLPLCHVYERAVSVWFNLGSGAVVNFAESIDTVTRDLREVQPTIFQSVPRIYEKMHAGVLIRAASASFLKKLNYRVWMGIADRLGHTLARTGGRPTAGTRVLGTLGYLFLYRSLKERLGLRRCRHAISGAAPIAPEILRFFMGIGVPIYEAYGMTENAIVATTNRPGRIRLGTVGEAYDEIELRIDDGTGEILVRHPGVFAGYWNQPEATARTVDADGWLHTGDVGEWVDGRWVKIVDRMKDIIITAGGKNISPSEIENSLKTSPFVKEAIVFGDRRAYLAALIGIEYDVVSEWAQSKGIAHTTYRDLSEKPEVIKLIQKVVDETNERFARVENVRKFRLIPKQLDHEEGELTATQKVKRTAIEKQFAAEIEALYGS